MSIETDEILESIYEASEKNDNRIDTVRSLCKVPLTPELLGDLAKNELVHARDDDLSLTTAGRAAAEKIVRRKRLAQVLLYHVLKIKDLRLHEIACEFEHVVFPEIEESICTMMGHPLECPFGTKIPPGDCCKRMQSEVRQVVKSLSDMNAGEMGRIAYIRTFNQVNQHKFCSMGLRPGVVLELHQKYPAIIVRIDHTEIAMDETVGQEIYVWPTT
ncbi:MAG: metal-dependent transcriptional regulator [Deltaproteobacteria bacterium]|nr:metal-dependent transcriptional regulator [Deltaproteobacteria bacterium]